VSEWDNNNNGWDRHLFLRTTYDVPIQYSWSDASWCPQPTMETMWLVWAAGLNSL